MALDGLIATGAFMLLVVVPMLGVTWHSVRSDHHSPSVLQELEEELEEVEREVEDRL